MIAPQTTSGPREQSDSDPATPEPELTADYLDARARQRTWSGCT